MRLTEEELALKLGYAIALLPAKLQMQIIKIIMDDALDRLKTQGLEA
jgi:hypothetical protein